MNDCEACRNGVHADCTGTGCGCYAREVEPHSVLAMFGTGTFAPVVDEHRPPRLMAQWALMPGDPIIDEDVIDTMDKARERLLAAAAKEGRMIIPPVIYRLVAEAWTEEKK